jgi:hypothetical protein
MFISYFSGLFYFFSFVFSFYYQYWLAYLSKISRSSVSGVTFSFIVNFCVYKCYLLSSWHVHFIIDTLISIVRRFRKIAKMRLVASSCPSNTNTPTTSSTTAQLNTSFNLLYYILGSTTKAYSEPVNLVHISTPHFINIHFNIISDLQTFLSSQSGQNVHSSLDALQYLVLMFKL